MEFITQHKLLSAIIVIAICAAAWWTFTQSSGPAPVLATTVVAGATSTQDASIVTTLLQLQAVTLSGTILTDPAFLSLQDYTTQIVTEPIGRPDPFAPVSPGTAAPTSTQKVNPNLFAPAKH